MDTYERIGRTYAATRVEDPRIAAPIEAALGDAHRVVNVGAGTGNYEPAGRDVVAVEPSAAMIAQRRRSRAAVVRARAEALPLRSGSFDAAMAVLTVHHWTDLGAGLGELRRVADRQVVFYFEPLVAHGFWGLDYFPQAVVQPIEREAPGLGEIAGVLDVADVIRVPVPPDCSDGFGTAFWCRPEAYLDPTVQAGMSWLALLPEADRLAGCAALRSDLDSGRWDERYGHLRAQASFDGGYRIAVAGR